MIRVLIIGGYGNFGSFISRRLAQEVNLHLIIACRSLNRAKVLSEELNAEAAVIDIFCGLAASLHTINPDIVIHTSGPFQSQGYTGKPFKTLVNGEYSDIFGWQGLRARKFPGLGWRLLGYCNVPDLVVQRAVSIWI